MKVYVPIFVATKPVNAKQSRLSNTRTLTIIVSELGKNFTYMLFLLIA